MVASETKARGIKKSLEQKGCDPKELERVFSPAGLKIGVGRPSDIALSIMAQVIQVKETNNVRNCKSKDSERNKTLCCK